MYSNNKKQINKQKKGNNRQIVIIASFCMETGQIETYYNCVLEHPVDKARV